MKRKKGKKKSILVSSMPINCVTTQFCCLFWNRCSL